MYAHRSASHVLCQMSLALLPRAAGPAACRVNLESTTSAAGVVPRSWFCVIRLSSFRGRMAVKSVLLLRYYAPAHRVGALSDDARLTSVCLSVCLSRTSGLSREQRGLGRLKLAQR